VRIKATSLSFFLAAASLAMASAAIAADAPDRSGPPKPAPARALKLPPVQKFTLENGLAVWIVENHEVPIATLALAVRSGATADPAGKSGLAAMTAEMLDEGAGGKSALEFDEEVSFLGASLDSRATWDYSVVSVKTPVKALPRVLPLFAAAATKPDFPQKEFDRVKKQALTGFLSARSEPRQIAAHALLRGVFGTAHRYGIPVAGTAAAVASFTVEDLRKYHRENYLPNNSILIASGDVTSAALLPALSEAFAKWEKASLKPVAVPQPKAQKGRRVLIVDRPGSAQSVIRIALTGPSRETPDYFSIEVANTLLGGSFTSRLNNNLREQKGYTYGAGSRFDMRKAGGLFTAFSDVETGVTGPALTEFMKELGKMLEPTPAADAERARNYAALGLGFEFETSDEIAAHLVEQAVYGLPSDYFDTYVARTLSVDGAAIQEAAKKYLDLSRLTIIVVGDRAKIEKPIRDLKLGETQIVPLDTVMGPVPVIPAS